VKRAALAVLAPLVAVAAAFAADEAVELVPARQAAPVTVDGRVLFEVVALEGSGVSAEQRAQHVANRIVEAARDRGVLAPRVRAVIEQDGASLFVGTRLLMLVRAADAEYHGLTVERTVELVTPIIDGALVRYRSDRTPGRLLRAIGGAAAVVLVAGLLLALYSRLYRRVRGLVLTGAFRRLGAVEERTAGAVKLGSIRSALALALSTVNVLLWLAALSVVVEICLSLFPYTRPFAAQMLGLVVQPLRDTGRAIITSIPSLVFVAVVVVVTRIVLRVVTSVFASIGDGTRTVAGFYPEWAQPTHRIVSIFVIVAAVVIAFPYIPGSESAAFKSISILLGVVVSLGSSSAVSSFINGLLLTYMRVLKAGDVVRIGDVLGTVRESGLVVTRVRTLHETEVAIPNQTIMSGQVVNYSRTGTAVVPTAVTIGYDAPWRQVHAMLELAAARTEGLRGEPAPFVLQSELADFYVRYELWVALADPWQLPRVMAALHANIQDQFNEHGVQIMSPHYMVDPARPAVVPRERWHTPPAR
jgi:small-conductance mechanosensitive channel